MLEAYGLAVLFGLVVSAALFFIVVWPRIEPVDEPEHDGASDADDG